LANSTIRIAFFADRPITVTIPTWKYTSLGMPRPETSKTEPSIPSGTASITDSGIAQLSYKAASSMNTTRTAKPIKIADWPAA
jgi:hypothetical protein